MKIKNKLTQLDFIKVVRQYEPVELSQEMSKKIDKGREIIENAINSGDIIYGVNTGFGELSNKRIKINDLNQLQINLVRSHAAGVGSPLSEEIVRGSILLLINSLAKGHSGVRKLVVERLIELLNKNITPIVPSFGSVGASGDLAPLSHIALVLLGEGKAIYNSKTLSGMEALKQSGISPVKLVAKEGLALINGTHVMLSIGILALYDSYNIINNAVIATALTTDVLRGTDAAYDPKVHKLRPHQGQLEIAGYLFSLMKGSKIRESHKIGDTRVQDAYSERCSPQVLGASLDALNYVRNVFKTEINSVTDNPLILEDGSIRSAGHFHGAPLALALDFLGIALCGIGNISERRINRLLDTSLSGLPAFLSKDPGKNSGLMLAQYTAAALVSQNKMLAHPSSVDSIPVSADKEDHVSMGMNSALKCMQIVENIENVISIEFLCASQGLEFITENKTSPPLQNVISEIRRNVPPLEQDRSISEDIKNIRKLIKQNSLVARVKPHKLISWIEEE
ncbi:MAG: histidine ammonia-lyase [Promethearchaeota archaeon]